MIARAHFILWVDDQARARGFYEAVLDTPPTLDVPGMTEFVLTSGAVLGLMPRAGIERLLPGVSVSDHGLRGEVYLAVTDAGTHHLRALAAGARELSALSPRDWGATVAYSVDLDGHLLAFAEAPPGTSRAGL